MKKKQKSDKYYASVILKDLIDNSRWLTLVEYILLAWKNSPSQLRKREVLNAITIEYLNNMNKNNKGKKNENIIKFSTIKLN
jgi:hypothetical protein